MSGCYQTSLTPMMVVGPAAGAAQGRLVSSAASTAFNYGVKEKTGKFPYQHIIKREKDKLVKKAASVEKNLIETSNEFKNKIEKSSQKALNMKKKKTEKIYVSAKKIKKITQETFSSNKPRYSYRSHK